MKRQIVYPGAIPLETDILNTNKNGMIALGHVLQDMLGTSTLFSGLGCVPTSPAGMTVNVNPGRAYSYQATDSGAYSSLAADAHLIVKQGILLDAVNFACPAPTTAGFSISYLIEGAFQEVDAGSVVLPYYNASNPAQAYSGPNGTGTPNTTYRDNTVQLQLKAGVAATSGSQATPTPDAGFNGLWVVTVPYGATSITSAMISQYTGAPFLGSSLYSQIQASGPDTARIQGLIGKNNAATPNTQFDFSALGVTLRNPATGGTAVATNTGTITNNVALAGPVANGRDVAAAFTASQWLYFYFIWNPATSTLATISSAATPAVGPALPSGFTSWAYIGAIYYGSSSTLALGNFRGSWWNYQTVQGVVTNGSSTSVAAINVSTFVPPPSVALEMELSISNLSILANSSGAYNVTCAISMESGTATALQIGLQGGGTANGQFGAAGTGKRVANLSQGFNYALLVGVGSGQLVSINVCGYNNANGGE